MYTYTCIRIGRHKDISTRISLNTCYKPLMSVSSFAFRSEGLKDSLTLISGLRVGDLRPSLTSFICEFRPYAQVSVSTLDVSNRQQARELLQSISATSHVAGIFHLAMRLRDKLLSNQVRCPPDSSHRAHQQGLLFALVYAITRQP